MTTRHDPGVYVGMPEDEYHADPSLGSSDIGNLLVSPETYYFNSPLNPDYVAPEETEAQRWGRAYHRLLLEGVDAYEATYAVRPNREDYPDALDTIGELRQLCTDMEISRGGKTKAEIIKRLRDAGWEGQVWDEIKAEFAAANEGKTLIPADLDRNARFAVKLVNENKDVQAALEGGFGEVSIFVKDQITGAPLKARVDWLNPQWFVDAKTFSNPRKKEIDRAIADACAFNGYNRQIVHYHDVVTFAKVLPDEAFHGVPADFIKRFKATEFHQCLFIFIGTDVPCVRARGMAPEVKGTSLLVWHNGYRDYRRGVEQYVRCVKHFGDKPWFVREPIRYFEDREFPFLTIAE